jgi:hypothetical protein
MRNIVSVCAGMALCLAFAAQGASAQTSTSGAPANAQAFPIGTERLPIRESPTHTSWPDAIRVMAARLWLERR